MGPYFHGARSQINQSNLRHPHSVPVTTLRTSLPITFVYMAIMCHDPVNALPSSPEGSTGMQCYSLPFGVIGMASHFLSRCTLLWIWEGRSPLKPHRPIKRHPWRGTIIGSIILICSIVLANFAYVRCRNNRALSWVVIWRAFQSILLGCSVIIASISKTETKPPQSNSDINSNQVTFTKETFEDERASPGLRSQSTGISCCSPFF